jgi:hypothetical protein
VVSSFFGRVGIASREKLTAMRREPLQAGEAVRPAKIGAAGVGSAMQIPPRRADRAEKR